MTRLRTWALLIFAALAVAYIAVFSPVQAQEARQEDIAGARPAHGTTGYLPVVLECPFEDKGEPVRKLSTL